MADLHIEDSTEGEEQERGERERERKWEEEREILHLRDLRMILKKQ